MSEAGREVRWLYRVSATLGLALALAPAGCGGRPSYWSTSPGAAPSVGLKNAVALIDDVDHRAVLLSATSDLEIGPPQGVPIGHHVATTAVSADGFHLFVLSTGDWPPRTSSDEPPTLTVIDTSHLSPTSPATSNRYVLSEPFPNLAIDPHVQSGAPAFAVAYQGPGAPSVFVENPNELVIFDLTRPGDPSSTSPNPVVHTIQSFGSSPQTLTFTAPLRVAPSADPRRLLVIQTQIDVTLFDLEHAFEMPPRPEVTVPLTSGATAIAVQPAAVAVDEFSTDPSDARIAVRTSNATNVYTIAFGPPDPGAHNDFKPTVNLTDVGGIPSDIAFVHTDAGLRLAALVPDLAKAVLVEPDTSLTTPVALPDGYSQLSIVTSSVVGVSMCGSASASASMLDVALLWNASAPSSGVALWTLSSTVCQPYFAVQVLDVQAPVSGVMDVPPSSLSKSLKVLQSTSGSNEFFVLDLASRTVFPLQTQGAPTLSVAPDGRRVWAFERGGTALASIDFSNLSPTPLWTDSPIDAVYDVACVGDSSGARALFAMHRQGTGGATIFNAVDPRDTSTTPRRVSGLLLEEAQ